MGVQDEKLLLHQMTLVWSEYGNSQLVGQVFVASGKGERDLQFKLELCLSNQKLVQWHLGATGLWVDLFHVHQCSAPASTGHVSEKGQAEAWCNSLGLHSGSFFSLDNSNYLATDTETELLQLWFIHWSQLLQSSLQRMKYALDSSISMARDLQLFSKSIAMKH